MGLDVNNEIKTYIYIYIRREGNPRGIPIDFRWITIHLSRFLLPISREGSGHENASAGIKQKVRTSEDERENAPRGSRFHLG